MAAGGCQSAARVDGPPLAGSHAADTPESRIDFWHQLSDAPLASYDDAFHALLLYFDGRDDAADYAGRVEALKSRGMLPPDFRASPDAAADRGTLAVALARGLGIKGGLSMRLLGGNSPRYALRALEHRGLYPESSPNQTFTGAELVGVIGRVEDFQRGNPAEDKPAAVLPGEATATAAASDVKLDAAMVAAAVDAASRPPVFLTMQQPGAAAPPATSPAPAAAATPENPAELKIVVTGVEGDVQVRATPDAKWEPAKADMRLTGTAEFRTGARSAVRFVIPPDQTYTLDRLGSTKVARAVFDGKRVKTDVGLEKGRIRYDLVRGAGKAPGAAAPAADEELDLQIEAAGVQYDSTLRSPNAALAVRGTLVSLYDQPPFAPEAVSLTGRAVFRNARRQLVAFGGQAKASVTAQHAGAAERALDVATLDPDHPTAQNDFDARQEALAIQRGGFSRGDVLVGDSGVTDEQLLPLLPDVLNFVLRWDGGPGRRLADLNLAVVSPLSTARDPDFVANPPFTLSLTPGEPEVEARRRQRYPRTSLSGGRIGKNHVGPEGLEIASWPREYPVGTYRVAVFNLVDAVTPPTDVRDPIDFRVDTFLNGQKLGQTITGTVGTLQVSPATPVAVPASAAAAAPGSLSTSASPAAARVGGRRGR